MDGVSTPPISSTLSTMAQRAEWTSHATGYTQVCRVACSFSCLMYARLAGGLTCTSTAQVVYPYVPWTQSINGFPEGVVYTMVADGNPISCVEGSKCTDTRHVVMDVGDIDINHELTFQLGMSQRRNVGVPTSFEAKDHVSSCVCICVHSCAWLTTMSDVLAIRREQRACGRANCPHQDLHQSVTGSSG